MPSTILDLIDLRSFSNVWFWLFLAVTWSRLLSHPLGIPVDMLREARANEDGARDRLALLAEILVTRHVSHFGLLGPVLVGVWAFVLSGLAILSVIYRVEFAQALLILAAPLAIASLIMTRQARHLASGAVTIDDLPQALSRMRLKLQIVALLAVFSSAVWGMFHNLSRMVL